MFQKLFPVGEFIVGNRSVFTKQQRLYNLANIIGVGFYLCGAFINILSQVEISLVLICLFLSILHGFYFYLGRFYGKYGFIPFLLVLQTLAVGIFAWFYNAGSQGPFPMLFVFAQTFLYSFIDRRWQVWVAFFLFIIFASLSFVEFINPVSISQYESSKYRLIDICLTYAVILIVYQVLAYVTQNDFELEHNKLLDSNRLVNEQREKLEQINLMRTRLLTVLSHDIRSPLTNIYSLIEACHEDLIEKEEFNTYTRELQNQISYNLGLLDSLVLWARAQSENFMVQKENVPLNDMVLQCVSVFEPTLKQKQLTVEIEIASTLKINCDVDIIKIVFRNVLSNAIKFSYSGSKISFSVKEFDNHLMLLITDYGVGMDAVTLNGLYSSELVSKLGTQKEKGSGMGLLMCRDFIAQVGGKLELTSEVNNGTVVSIQLEKA